MTAHQFDPDMLPDSEFEPGTLAHLVVGNRARSLDPRRTPFHVTEVRVETGLVVLDIDAFEDRGAHWEVPFESIDGYQFARGSARAPHTDVARFEQACARFDRPLEVGVDSKAARQMATELGHLLRSAADWLDAHSTFLAAGVALDPTSRDGSPALADDFRRYMEDAGGWEMEEAFATQWVRNPNSGELVKGHRIVLAEIGLVPYRGKVVRDPALFEDAWNKTARGLHVIQRLAFLRALFARLRVPALVLYRGLSSDGPPSPRENETFVSATTDFEIARSCFGDARPSMTGVLYRQEVPVDRIFMTYFETAQMNAHYREAEVVLLWTPDDVVF